jgi:site-specific DNA-adenine methylase
MFSYYGSKSKIAHLYPKPKYDTIIEPFAGSARYSLLHWERDVWLFDTSPYVYEVWRYLQQASKNDILNLPDVPSKVSLKTIKGLTEVERYLIGFHLCRGKSKPRHTGHGQNSWSRDKIRIADSLYKIRHWLIFSSDYRTIVTPRSAPVTFFVDPPYKLVQSRHGNSDRYPKGDDIDYEELAQWCWSRNGQIIVCEGRGADWLPFQLLVTTNANTNSSSVKKNDECVFVNG